MGDAQGWRHKKDDVDQGEVGWSELRALARDGDLDEADWVFSPAKGDWVKAWEVPGLFEAGDETATPLQPANPADDAARRRQRIIMLVIAVDVVITLIVGIVLLVVFTQS